MAFKKISTTELDQWIAQNPGKKYRVGGQEFVAPPRQKSALENILLGITKPLRAVPGSVAAAISGREDYDNPFLTEEEQQSLVKDPTMFAAKSAAGLAAYGIPVGGGQAATTLGRIGTAAGRGAGSGALAGFGASEEGSELQSILSGGAIGGLAGGVLQGVGEGAKALAGRASKTQVGDQAVKNLGPSSKTLKDVGGWNAYKQRAQTFYDEAARLGLKTSNRFERSDALNAILSRRGQEIGGILENSQASISVKNILSKLDNNQKLKLAGLDDKAFIDNIRQLLSSQGDEISGVAAKATIEQLDDIAGGFSKLSGDVSGQRNTVIKEVRNALRSELGKKIPEVNVPLKVQSELLDIADDIYTKTAKGESFGVPLLGLRVGGTGVSKGSDFISSLAAGVSQPRAQMDLSGLSRILQGGQRAIPAGVSLTGQQSPQRAPEQVQDMGTMPQGPQIDTMAIIQAVLNGELSTTEAKFIMELMAGSGGAMPKTESGRKAMVARDAAVNALSILGQDQTVAGKTQGLQNIFYDITGQANTATAYKAQLETLRSQVFNALGGASLTPTEKEQYEKFLPKVTDSPQQAAQKIQGLIPMLESLMGAEVPATSDSALLQILGL